MGLLNPSQLFIMKNINRGTYKCDILLIKLTLRFYSILDFLFQIILPTLIIICQGVDCQQKKIQKNNTNCIYILYCLQSSLGGAAKRPQIQFINHTLSIWLEIISRIFSEKFCGIIEQCVFSL